MQTEKSDYPVMAFSSQAEFEQWLDENHATANGLWIKVAKKSSGIPSVTYEEAVLTALCYGWIDGQAKKFDENHHIQKCTPRRARSKWSKINCGRAERLIAEGKMRPAGLAEIERAKADGRWDAAYDSPKNMEVPEDLRAALDQNEAARAFFETLNSTNRYAVLYQIHDAKRPETRARRIEKFVQMLAEGKKLY